LRGSFLFAIEDLTGRVLTEERKVEHGFSLSVADLQEGIYFIRIRDTGSNFVFSKKIAVIK